MAAKVQSKAQSTAATLTVSVTLDATPTNGNYLIGAYRESQIGTVTLPSGWAWATGSPYDGTSGARQSGIAYKLVSGDSATVTFTSGTSDTKTLYVAEVAGLAASSPEGPHAENPLAGSSTSKQTGSTGTLPQADMYAIGCVNLTGASGGSEAVDSSFTLATPSLTTFLVGDRITTATTALNPSFSWLTSRTSFAQIATFKGETITGTAANTLADVTSSASGTVTAPAITGTAANTLAGVTSSASGSVTGPITGTAANTLAGVTSSATGVLEYSGTAANTLAGVTSAATGSVDITPVTGTAANVLAGVTSTASATVDNSTARDITVVQLSKPFLHWITGKPATTEWSATEPVRTEWRVTKPATAAWSVTVPEASESAVVTTDDPWSTSKPALAWSASSPNT